MSSNPFIPLATIQLPSPARLLPSSWCPDKDLLVVITQLGGKDRLSLWKMQGSKKWEVGFDSDITTATDEIVGIAWSPDGQSIAAAHNPPRITIHSIQDGHEERSLPVSRTFMSGQKGAAPLVDVWWAAQVKKPVNSIIPDIFRRGDNITGSAHSMLKSLPLLDSLHDESAPLTAADLFAFQGKQTRPAISSLPPLISSWPTLPSDLLSASIQPPKLGGNRMRPGEDLDEADDANVDSLLITSDNSGYIYCYLDGTYSLGAIRVGGGSFMTSFYKDRELLFAHSRYFRPPNAPLTSLRAFEIHLPYLQRHTVRDVARVSSSVRELVWYLMRVIRDMRASWFASETHSGARELGPRWVQEFEARQKDEFGQEEPNAILDMTVLLTTGRSSEALGDYLGSGVQVSERGIQKWETTMVDALTKLRDLSEKNIASACQRLHILLEEVFGWSLLPQYHACAIDPPEVEACMQMAGRAIVLAGWLAATSREELGRFKEFISWLKYEVVCASTPLDAQRPPPKHDILEVNDYLASGLVVSPIDKWFTGPIPKFSVQDLGVPATRQDLNAAMERARDALKDPQRVAWLSVSPTATRILGLINDRPELAARCQRIFVEAAGAATRSSQVLSAGSLMQLQDTTLLHAVASKPSPLIRERTKADDGQPGFFLQHLLIQTPQEEDRSRLCIARMHHGPQTGTKSLEISVAVMECSLADEEGGGGTIPFRLLDAQFFDDAVLMVVYRTEEEGGASIASVGYADLMYTRVELEKYVSDFARESLMAEVMGQLRDGRLSAVPARVIRTRPLAGCREGGVSLAVNGRVGRRVACVLDGAGVGLELLDIEGEEEEEEEEEEMTTAEG
ncbi:uncharacterized protein FIBRA_04046 [Fibroporia radiculosa]|uniref:Anaphase-promoting complex subunit 4 n=1 Tax=Fibroporia radiculosa TaxID=599839 RepID=J4G6R9_9APHY|nr:uncharacterized protein FIBRA_04046 [Fibroporia radiculosa]CCM01973.1 predicted protein [Fibroporia radiculosa]